ncbi:hypothetical protein AB0L00_41735 [Actinoallomurus sp. NPDC052308]|uniref:hypothetical protein n=1 Tax=Actinoallomurus sp. NPDC052308 TaxID=3155530 RepID=UPI00341A7C62
MSNTDATKRVRVMSGRTLLRPTGVYFITASDALQAASAMAPAGSSLGTSRFTGEIVEGLPTGRIKESGWITPDDLFEYLTAQMARNGIPEERRPTKSTIRATRTLPFARSVARSVVLPVPPRDAAETARRSPATRKARELASSGGRDGVDWQRLLRYYVHCLAAGPDALRCHARAALRSDLRRRLGLDVVLPLARFGFRTRETGQHLTAEPRRTAHQTDQSLSGPVSALSPRHTVQPNQRLFRMRRHHLVTARHADHLGEPFTGR